jgi:hypothetical protein
MGEPEWMKKISSNTVCGYYYIIFIFNAVIATTSIFLMVFVLPFLGMPKGAMLGQTLLATLVLGLAVANSLFLYILCDRSLRQ